MTTFEGATAIERREFTYCVANWDGLGRTFTFLVMTAARPEAMARARVYALVQRPDWGEPREIDLYPRNYIREARRLYRTGKHD